MTLFCYAIFLTFPLNIISQIPSIFTLQTYLNAFLNIRTINYLKRLIQNFTFIMGLDKHIARKTNCNAYYLLCFFAFLCRCSVSCIYRLAPQKSILYIYNKVHITFLPHVRRFKFVKDNGKIVWTLIYMHLIGNRVRRVVIVLIYSFLSDIRTYMYITKN